jgi:D-3-phosphoglycerate dehydrogenase / 2-oxoglutarate reductase
MNIVILDDYQDAVRKLNCASKLDPYNAKVYTNTVKGLGQLSIRLKDADVIVLIRERTHINRALIEKLPRLKLIVQTGKAGPHIDIDACTERGIAVADGTGSPIAPAEMTWALIMAAARRLPQYISNLKHGAWQQSGLKSSAMPPNFGLGTVLHGKTMGIWGYGKIGQLVGGYAKAFGMQVMIWGREASRLKALQDGHTAAPDKATFFEQCDVISLHLRLNDATRGIVTLEDLSLMKTTALMVNTSRAELIAQDALHSTAVAPAWLRSMCLSQSPFCKAMHSCAWRTASARRTSAMWSKTPTSCTSGPRLTTWSTSSKAPLPTS